MKKLVLALMFFGFLMFNVQSARATYEPWGFAIYNGTKAPADYAIPGATLGQNRSCKL